MSPSTEPRSEPPEVDVQVYCANGAAELMLVDGTFKVLARGASPLTARVPAGIYAIKAKIGGRTTERLERLEPALQPYQLHIAPPEIDTPIATLAAHDPPLKPASVQDTALTCELFVCVRGLQGRPLKELAIVGPTGALLEPNEVALPDEDPGAYRALCRRVALGKHTLRIDTGPEISCISLPVAEGWCLGVFIAVRWKEDAAHAAPSAAIDDISVLFKRLSPATPITKDDINILESVRLAMLERRGIVPQDTLDGMLGGKFEKPMLGIYAAHILLFRVQGAPAKEMSPAVAAPAPTGSRSDLALAKEVIRNIAALLHRSHPDVVALRWGYERLAAEPALDDQTIDVDWVSILQSIDSPPLLVASWDLLIDCANHHALTHLATLPVFQPAGNLAISGLMWLTYRPTAPLPAAAGTPEPSEAGSPVPASQASGPAKLISSWFKGASQSFVARISDAIASSSLGPQLGLLRIEINPDAIRTTQDAVAAFQRLAHKASWDMLQTTTARLSPDFINVPAWSAIQKDLLQALGRAVKNPAALAGVDQAWIDLFLKSRRVPLSTLASALYGLDVAAVTSDYVRKIRSSLAKTQPAASNPQLPSS